MAFSVALAALTVVMMGIFLPNADLRSALPSFWSNASPEDVMIINWMSPLETRSPAEMGWDGMEGGWDGMEGGWDGNGTVERVLLLKMCLNFDLPSNYTSKVHVMYV